MEGVETITVTRNRELCEDYIKQNGPHFRYPKVTDQIECLPTPQIGGFAYNPTIMDSGDHLTMFCRYHRGDEARTRIKKVLLQENTGIVTGSSDFVLQGKSFEDPRLFKWQGRNYLSWVESCVPEEPFRSVVKFWALDDGPTKQVEQPPFPGNDWSSIQKNYVFFECEGDLWCIYHSSPRRLFKFDKNQWHPYDSSKSVGWPYGEIRGGTSPVPFGTYWLRFFHSRLDNDAWLWHVTKRWYHRYFVGAYLMETKPPFNVVRVSRKPILYGSEDDNLGIHDRTACLHYKPNVVFPCGLVARNDHWLLSVGVNDSGCEICKVRESNLNL